EVQAGLDSIQVENQGLIEPATDHGGPRPRLLVVAGTQTVDGGWIRNQIERDYLALVRATRGRSVVLRGCNAGSRQAAEQGGCGFPCDLPAGDSRCHLDHGLSPCVRSRLRSGAGPD